MKAIIVDDEQLAREELKYLLGSCRQVELLAEAENITQAQQLIETLRPDLIFLDIDMPGGGGFELLERLAFVPAVIFTTAYDQYAIRAFEVDALDYLLKPIDEKRLQKALQKVAEQPGPQQTLSADAKIFIKDGNECWFVRVGDIMLFDSIGNYCKVYFNDKQPMIKRSLAQLEERLPEDKFIRANRGQLVNLDAIVGIESLEGGILQLTLKNGREVEMSRRQAQLFKGLNAL
ncbi:LytR/AlgR family response regulator transcription factor [Shewanella sedimentimangrovi]|uniref:Response regulator n=1 Tax=Shewanella sedimentimangrovi TaxID=2814293 RepID=A0ABX7QYI6_9GAMM|nr:response regulator [Shewanella sedimentimangrovi]QSX35675.1 response regulator [Shewanella sedimentimangrovi]